MNIDFIDSSHSLYPAVKRLGTKYKATLGFMPDGGFDDYAARRNIITASEGGELMGYLMFRVTGKYSKVTIVHLVVDGPYRGRGISTLLLNAVRDWAQEKGAIGMVLNCRKDYKNASSMWERFGFFAHDEHRSRSYEENYLVTWWYDFHVKDLFSEIYESSTKVRAMMDLNIIAKLRDKGQDVSPKEDPMCLMQDWLMEETELCYSPEVYNEVLRDNNRSRAQRTREYVRDAFTEARFDNEEQKRIATKLLKILPGRTDNDESDRKQVASCIAAGIPYFITYDAEVIKKKDVIESNYEIQVYTPQEFLLEIDQLLHRGEYAPSLLKAVRHHSVTKLSAAGLKKTVDKFLYTGAHEKKALFENTVNECLNCGGELWTMNSQGEDVAFYGWSDNGERRTIHFLRILDGPLSNSLFCQIVTNCLQECVAVKRKQMVLKERFLKLEQRAILLRLGFQTDEGDFVKWIRNEIVMRRDVAPDEDCVEELVQVELKYYPLKIRDLEIPTYIIPIKDVWAGQLFDNVISSEDIFGADPTKLWYYENVYYRSRLPLSEVAPSRILWYVCKRKKSGIHSMMVVGSSYLTEVHTGKAKELFRQFKHYGIYEWRDLDKLRKGENDKDIKVLKFSHTELFDRAVSYDRVQEVLKRHGYGEFNFNSPLKVKKEVFFEIYEEGFGYVREKM